MHYISKLKSQRGVVLITAYMIIASLSLLTAAAIKIATTEYGFARRYFLSTKAYYLAEAGTDMTAYSLAGKVANYEEEPSGANCEWTDLCSTTTDFLSTGFDVDTICVTLDTDHAGSDPTTRERHYMLTSTARDPLTGIERTINQIVIRRKGYTFQHAIFYAGDLELLPGQDMLLTGKLHSNHDIYIASDGASLTVDTNYLCSAGNVYNMRKDKSGGASGTVQIKIDGSSSYARMLESGDPSPLDCRRSDWALASQTRWNGTVLSSVHGVTEKAVPEPRSTDPDGFYAQNANVKVINGSAYDGASELVEGVDVPHGTIATSDTFYNFREGKYIRMTDIDIEKLAGWCNVDSEGNEVPPGGDYSSVVGKAQLYSNHLPANALLYATRDDTTPDQQPGIRLLNGSEIHSSGGLTVVSNDPAYIQGDFNNINKKPASVFADAVNIVSNNWDDGNSDGDKSARQATETTVNAAFIAGINETSWGDYSGGLENYPRLHEDWGGITLTIRGAFVSLWNSQIATGRWEDQSYSAPIRNWDWDSDYANLDDLPSYTPYAVEIQREAIWLS
ncbi:MAG: hypothetical protein GF409_03630 [Candidatus Omnitrophica bacterium]|nr:hypothetical protein [Candidatus Omnitrophota bacterium]